LKLNIIEKVDGPTPWVSLPILLNVFSSRILMLDPVSIRKSTFELLIFTVIENLLCYDTSVELNIVPIIASVSSSSEILCNKYSDVFKGIGNLKDVKVKIHVDDGCRCYFTICLNRRLKFLN
jgi:hypothetical protein